MTSGLTRQQPPQEQIQPKVGKICTGRAFLLHLQQAGLIPPNARRVVIEADCQGFVRIFTESFGDSEFIKIVTPESLQGALKVRWGDRIRGMLKRKRKSESHSAQG